MHRLIGTVIATMSWAVPAIAETAPASVTPATIRAAMVGTWKGTLEYRDYQTDKWFGLPMNVSIEMMRDGFTLIRHADFDDGPQTGIVTITSIGLLDQATGTEQTATFRKGRTADLIKTTLRVTRAEAVDRWTLVETSDGEDDNRPAHIRETTTRDGDTMVTLKEVDFTDDKTETWLTRNRTTLTRQ